METFFSPNSDHNFSVFKHEFGIISALRDSFDERLFTANKYIHITSG